MKAWEKHGRRGIFEHATGSGKTYTAICAIRDSLEKGETVLILVPSIALLEQWKNEIEANMHEVQAEFLLCGDIYTEWKQPGVLAAWTASSNQHRVILASMDTASNPQFIKRISQGSHLFIVADEMHRLGSQNDATYFQSKLALVWGFQQLLTDMEILKERKLSLIISGVLLSHLIR